MRKKRIGILFGGRSAEHEVALQSAKSIIDAIDKKKYDIVLIGIDKKGKWHLSKQTHFLLNANNPRLIALNKSQTSVTLVPWQTQQLTNLTNETTKPIDVIFPVLHGTYGEDGTVQGLLKLANIPFVGASVLGSAVGMDKDVAKRLLRDAGLPIAKFLVLKRNNVILASEAPYRLVQGEARPESPISHPRESEDQILNQAMPADRQVEDDKYSFDDIVKKLSLPFFAKPANAGSSIGVSKVKSESDFEKAVDDAFSYDNKILLEEFIYCREIECSVLGNENPIASLPGEIIPTHEFYDYDAKYIDENGAALQIPATLPQKKVKEVQALAVKTFQTLCCEGMGRVDFFLDKKNRFFVNEINTIPGFTKISMYPKLWEASGIPYPKLIDRLIRLAIERHERDQKLKTSYTTR